MLQYNDTPHAFARSERRKDRILRLVLLGLALLGRLSAFSVVFPDDAGVINVKSAYGAKGDGITDDTSAIQAAIREHVGQFKFGILYFPKGIYLISDTLTYLDRNGKWGAYLSLQGEDEDSTIIQLADRAPRFQDLSHPRAMIFTASNRGSANPSASDYNPDGSGNEGFRNHIMNLSIHSGHGNPAAVGIDYMANNNTRISDVNISSGDGLGVYGLNIQRGYPGPMLLKHISINGFSTAIAVSNSYGVWIEHLSLSGQNISGIDVNNGSVSIRDLQTVDSVPVIRMPDWTSVVSAVDLNLQNGSPNASAIEMGGSRQNTLFVRNAICSGYSSLISKNRQPLDGDAEAEWSSTTAVHLYNGTAPKSLDLAVAETPLPRDTDPSQWVNVLSFGAQPFYPLDGNSFVIDNSVAIQAAIDSGAKTIYFPPGLYAISKSVQVRGEVERVLGLNASLMPLNLEFSPAGPAIEINDTTSDDVFIDGLGFQMNFWVPGPSGNEVATFGDSTVLDNSSHTLVLTNIDHMGYANTTLAEGGMVFIESVFGYSPMRFVKQTVYARNLDPEPVTQKPHVVVSGGQLWVLGLKTEGQSTVLLNEKGAQTEILGEVASVWTNVPKGTPMVSNVDSSLSLTAFRGNPGPNTDYGLQVFEQMGSVSKQLFSAMSIASPRISPPYGTGSAGSIFVDTLQVALTLQIAPTALAFNSTGLQTTATVTLTNESTITLEVLSVSTSLPDVFRVSGGTCQSSVAPSSSCTINVTFTPNGGSQNAVLSVTLPSPYGTQTIGLSTLSPSLSIQGPASIGPQTRDTSSQPRTYSLQNLTNSSIAISSIAMAGADASDFIQRNDCPSLIPAGQGCQLWLRYAPTYNSAASASASIVVSSSTPGSPHSFAVSGRATGLSQALLCVDSPQAGKTVSGTIPLSGWAISDSAAITGVTLAVDGKALGAATYRGSRPDVCTVYPDRAGCPYVGWSMSFNTATFPDGPHTLTVSAASALGNTTIAVSFTIANWSSATPPATIICIDSPNAFTTYKGVVQFSGWAIDNTVAISSSVSLAVDGVPVAAAAYGGSRPDVCIAYPSRAGCPNVGWSVALDTRQFSNGTHTLAVTAQTVRGEFATVASPFRIVNPTPSTMSAYIDVPASAPVNGMVLASGWAIDSSTTIASVSLSIDGVSQGAASTNSRPDVCQVFGNLQGCPNVGWKRSIDTTKLADGPHTLGLLSTNSNGQELNLTKLFTVSNLKNTSARSTRVCIDVPGPASGPLSGVVQFSGWAIDQTASIATIDLTIDGVPFSSLLPSGSRPDVCAAFPGSVGCPLVGWATSFDSSVLADGKHVLQITATSEQGLQATAAAAFVSSNESQSAARGQIVCIDLPSANVTLSGTVTMAGWAVDVTGPVQKVIVSIDGLTVGTASYATPRPDVCSYSWLRGVNCPNVGWSYSLDTTYFSNGVHVLQVAEYSATGSASTSRTFVVNNVIIINCDYPQANASVSGTAGFSGWVISSTTPVQTVTFSIDSIAVGPAQYGALRPDVCAVFPNRPGCPNVGWMLSLNTTAFANGLHVLEITAASVDSVQSRSVPFWIANRNIPAIHTKVSYNSPLSSVSVPSGATAIITADRLTTWKLRGRGAIVSQHGPSVTILTPSHASATNTVGGCQVLPTDSVYSTPVTSLPIHPQSATWIAQSLSIAPVAIGFGEAWGTNLVDGTVPKTSMTFLYSTQRNGAHYPLLRGNNRVREMGAVTTDGNTDHHMVTVDHTTCHFYETYHDYLTGQAPDPSSSYTANSGYDYGSDTYNQPSASDGGGTTDAAGLPLMPLTVHLSDIQAGVIRHALRFTSCAGCISHTALWPATGSTAWASGAAPMGSRWRLKPSFRSDTFSRKAQVFLRALQQYGMILADIGRINDIQLDQDVNLDPDMQSVLAEIQAAQITQSNFDIVDESSLMIDPNSSQAQSGSNTVLSGTDSDGNTITVAIVVQPVLVGSPAPVLYPQAGVSYQLASWVNNTTDQTVNWILANGAGSVTPSGRYTAPRTVLSPMPFSLVGTAAGDPTNPILVSGFVLPAGPLRINVGSPNTYIDSKQQLWLADTIGFLSGSSMNNNGTYPGSKWDNVPDLINLYGWDKYTWGDDITYGPFLVPNGNYIVYFHFAENNCAGTFDPSYTFNGGLRTGGILDLDVNGTVTPFDVGAAVQDTCLTAAIAQIPIQVTNGLVRISVQATGGDNAHQAPFLSALQIIPSAGMVNLALMPVDKP